MFFCFSLTCLKQYKIPFAKILFLTPLPNVCIFRFEIFFLFSPFFFDFFHKNRNGINGVTSSLSDLLNVVPTEVLAGAVKVLSDLSRVTSTAQPGAAPPLSSQLVKRNNNEVSGGGGDSNSNGGEEGEEEGEEGRTKRKKKEMIDEHSQHCLTLTDLQDHLATTRRRRESEQDEVDCIQNQDGDDRKSVISISSSRTSSRASSHDDPRSSSKNKRHQRRRRRRRKNADDFAEGSNEESFKEESKERSFKEGSSKERSFKEGSSKEASFKEGSKETSHGNGGGLFTRMSKRGTIQETNSQLASDMRRSKGETNRMGGLPSTPFDLLVLDPYGVGLEVLQCVHVSRDHQGKNVVRLLCFMQYCVFFCVFFF